MHGKSRGNKRGTPQVGSSSSEYSSPSSSRQSNATQSENGEQGTSPPDRHRQRTESPSPRPYGISSAEEDGGRYKDSRYGRKEADTDSQQTEEDEDNRGKKGPLSTEMEQYRQAYEHDGDATQSESEREEGDVVRGAYDDGNETEEESESPATTPEKKRKPAKTSKLVMPKLHKMEDKTESTRRGRNQAVWSRYDPVVLRASELVERSCLEPSSLAYARLTSAGKGVVDYLVRCPTVTIGRVGFGADCEIRTMQRTISRVHAKLYWDHGLEHWMIMCVSQRHGMLVDGSPLGPAGFASLPIPVSSQTLIEIGDVAFYFLAALGETIHVSDLVQLEHNIRDAKLLEEQEEQRRLMEQERAYEEEYRRSGRRGGRGGRGGSRGDRFAGRKKGKDKRGKYGRGSRAAESMSPDEVSSSVSSDSEPEDTVIPDLLQDPKYKLPLMSLTPRGKRKAGSDMESSGKKRRRKSKSYDDDDISDADSGMYSPEWNKKEKGDFIRALFTVGVDAVYDNEGRISGFDWTRFRNIAEFPKKSDELLEEYYRRVMVDVHGLLDEEELEKKTKGPRTKHKPGCECTVCENARRARQKMREAQGLEDRGSDPEDAERAAARGKDRLVGLVTAQKLRVRIGIHEAARRIDTEAGDIVFQKLDAQRHSGVKEFPGWWAAGHHDRELMRGCQLHGVGQWMEIWEDNNLELFMQEKERAEGLGYEVEWPTNQATMKRVREIANAITTEMKRVAKRDAMEERERRRRAKKAKRLAEKRAMKRGNEGGSSRRREYSSPNGGGGGGGSGGGGDGAGTARVHYNATREGVEEGESTEEESGSDQYEGDEVPDPYDRNQHDDDARDVRDDRGDRRDRDDRGNRSTGDDRNNDRSYGNEGGYEDESEYGNSDEETERGRDQRGWRDDGEGAAHDGWNDEYADVPREQADDSRSRPSYDDGDGGSETESMTD